MNESIQTVLEQRGMLFKIGLLAVVTFVFIVVFATFFHAVGEVLGALTMVPVLLAGFFFGVKGGLLAATLFIPINFVLFQAVAGQSLVGFLANWPGIVSTLILGAVVGWLSDLLRLSRKLTAAVGMERKALEEEIVHRRRNEARLRLQERAINATMSGIVITDPAQPDNPIIFVNAAFEAITGYAQAEVLGRNPRLLQGPKTDRARVAQLREAVLAGKGCNVVLENYRKDGKPYWNDLTVLPLRDKDGRLTNFIGIQNDITERKRVEEAVFRRDSVLEAIGFAAEQFLKASTWSPRIREVLERFGRAMEASRVSFFENSIGPGGERLTSQQHEWVAPGYASYISNPMLQNMSFEAAGLTRWEDTLARGGLISGGTSGFPQSEHLLVRPDETGSILAAPIFLRNEWWGFLVFDFCDNERECSPVEIDAIRAATELLGLAIYRERVEQEVSLLAHAVKSISESVCVVGEDLDIRFVNKALIEAYGYAESDLIGKPVTMLFAPSFPRKVVDEVLAATKAGGWQGEVQWQKKDGGELSLYCSTSYLRDQQGQPFAYVVVATDISERKRAEEALRRSKEQYQALIENLSDVVFTVDMQGRFTYVSPSIEKISGYLVCDILGTGYERFVHPDDLRLLKRSFRRIVKNKSDQVEVRAFDKRAGIRYLRISSHTLFEANNLKGIGGVLTDITESKERLLAEEQARLLEIQAEDLHAAREAAEQALSLKSEFMANMSHEIRTPLNGIIGVVDLLRQTKLSPRQLGYVGIINKSGDALLSIINDILDFSKIEAGMFSLESVHMDLRDVVDQTVQMLVAKAAEKGLELVSLIYNDVPNSLRGDPVRLRQILLNLISNAIKFTEHGEVIVRVTSVVDEPHRRRLRFSVSDTGIGISKEGQAKLFQPFTQADGSTTRKYRGTGLGLSITKRIIDLMGGSISLESEVGKGSTFWFELPFAKETEDRDEREFSPPQNSPVHHGGQGLLVREPLVGKTGRQVHVLVVEDKEVNQFVLTSMLHELGCRVSLASNGLEAVTVAQNTAYDIVFMDCHLPEIDGWEATFRIREMEGSERNTVIIAVTADALAGDKERCFAAGMDDYISKPVKLRDLDGLLHKWTSTPVAQEPPRERNTEAVPETAILDHARIRELLSVGGEDDPAVLIKVVNRYLEDAPLQIAKLQAALAISDWKELDSINHSLNGTSANVGAVRLVGLCTTLAMKIRDGELCNAQGIIKKMQREFDQVEVVLSEELRQQVSADGIGGAEGDVVRCPGDVIGE